MGVSALSCAWMRLVARPAPAGVAGSSLVLGSSVALIKVPTPDPAPAQARLGTKRSNGLLCVCVCVCVCRRTCRRCAKPDSSCTSADPSLCCRDVVVVVVLCCPRSLIKPTSLLGTALAREAAL
jgi:hypothetical protein